MEEIEFTPERVETTVETDGSIYPGGERVPGPMYIQYTKQDHPLLQKFIEAGLGVYIMHKEWTIEGDGNSSMVIRIYRNRVSLEYISTQEKERRCGNGSKLMQQLIDIADETRIILRTELPPITAKVNKGLPIHPHPVVAQGAKGKKKIPKKQLKRWFEKFGFKKQRYLEKQKVPGVCYMKREPI